MQITKADFDAWKANPVTKAVFAQIDEELTDMAKDLLTRRTIPGPVEFENVRGRAQAFEDLKNMDFQDA